jgi:hypothetical protein
LHVSIGLLVTRMCSMVYMQSSRRGWMLLMMIRHDCSREMVVLVEDRAQNAEVVPPQTLLTLKMENIRRGVKSSDGDLAWLRTCPQLQRTMKIVVGG